MTLIFPKFFDESLQNTSNCRHFEYNRDITKSPRQTSSNYLKFFQVIQFIEKCDTTFHPPL